jgi:uncharacterized protein (DUF1810 family)
MTQSTASAAADDPFDLNRFWAAQQGGVYEQAFAELRRVRKESHWMWYIFPQVAGLGNSSPARAYAIKGMDEARAYLNHPVLGPRLLECSRALLESKRRSASEIFGYPDDLKLRSSMTLFASVMGADSVFLEVLSQYYGGQMDPRTIELLKKDASGSGP